MTSKLLESPENKDAFDDLWHSCTLRQVERVFERIEKWWWTRAKKKGRNGA
jgi:hypothetical protein